MHDDQRSTADDVFAVVLVIGALLCMAVYALVVYVIIPLLILAAVVGVIGLIIAGMVCYVRSHAWVLGGVVMLSLYCLALALAVYAATLAHASMTDSAVASAAVLTGLLLLLTLLVISVVKPVVRRRDAEAEWAELELLQHKELVERERQAREDEEECRKREDMREEEQTLHPGEAWHSSFPIPCGAQVAVQINGTYSYRMHNNYSRQYHADGCYAWLDGTNPGHYEPHNLLFFDASAEPAHPFVEFRASHRYRFLYRGTGERLAVFLRRDHAFTSYSQGDDSLTISIAPLTVADQEVFRTEQEDHRRRQEEEAAATREREAEEEQRRREQAHRAWQKEQRRIQAQYDWLCEQHEYSELTCFEDNDFIEEYATKYRTDLLANRTLIMEEYDAFHNHTPEALERFRTEQPHLYLRAWAVFRWRALAAAVCLFVEEPPPAAEEPPAPPPETPEEARAREEAEARAREELRHFREDLRDEELFRNLDRLGVKKQRLAALKKQYPNLETEISALERQFSRESAPRRPPASPEEKARDTSARPRERY